MDKILEKFILNPEKEFYVRELSKILKESPTTVSKKLKQLEKEKILVSKKSFNHLLFFVNEKSNKFKNIKIKYNLDKMNDSGLIFFIEKKLNYPESIVLFGSFSNGTNNKESDIDIFIKTSKKIDLNLEKFEKKLKHRIHLIRMSQSDIEKNKKQNKELLNSIINGITLSGFLEVFK